MVPYFRIFGFTVQAYGLLFLIAIWTGLEVVLRQARRLGLEANHISNLVFYALGATVFWAHVWFTWSPTGLLTGARFSPPSADTHGRGGSTDLLESPAAAGWATLDALAPGLAMTLALSGWALFWMAEILVSQLPDPGVFTYGTPFVTPFNCTSWSPC